MKKKTKTLPKKAKLIADGGFYKFVPLEKMVMRIELPVMRRIDLSEPSIDYQETWHFKLVFDFVRATKTYVEFRQVNVIKVAPPRL